MSYSPKLQKTTEKLDDADKEKMAAVHPSVQKSFKSLQINQIL